MEGREAECIKENKIPISKIVRFKKKRHHNEDDEQNDKAQIVHITDCTSIADVEIIIERINANLLPKIFAIVIDLNINDEDEINVENFKANIFKIFDRDLILQVGLKDGYTYYIKWTGDKDFGDKINLNSSNEYLKKSFLKFNFTVRTFINVIKDDGILDADLKKINAFFDLQNSPHTLFCRTVETENELCFRLLNLFHFPSVKSQTITAVIRTKNFNFFLAFLDAYDISQIDETLLGNILNDKNIFLEVIKNENSEVFDYLLGFLKKFPALFSFNQFEKAMNLAFSKENFVFFHKLGAYEFIFNAVEEKKKEEIIKMYEKYLDGVSELHESISNGNFTNTLEFIKKNPKQRLFKGLYEVSAIECSIEKKQFKIYALLKANGLRTEDEKIFTLKIESLSDEEREIIRDENEAYFTISPDAYMGILLSTFSFDPNSPVETTDINKMLFTIRKFNEINQIMLTVSQADVKFHIDLKTEGINVMDPSQSRCALGVTYHTKNLIYIAKNDSINQRYGTFAHELTHYGLFLMYENDCLPYCKGDTERETEWNEIVEEVRILCEKNRIDVIISSVFTNYKVEKHSIELATRINECLAFYHDNEKKITELEKVLDFLFDFYRNKILKDFQIPNFYQLILLNNNFRLLDSIESSNYHVKTTNNTDLLDKINLISGKKIILSTNSIQLTLSKLLNELKSLPGNKLNLKTKNLFIDLERINYLSKKSINLIRKGCFERIIVIGNKFDEILRIIEDSEDNIFWVFVMNRASDLSYEILNINHAWNDLTYSTKQEFSGKNIQFQSKNIELSEILENVNKNITNEIFQILCTDKNIKINSRVFNSIQNYIPRSIERRKKVKFFVNLSVLELINENSTEIIVDKKVVIKIESEILSLDDFILREMKEELIVVISDIAGSGKTTLLIEIHKMLLEKFPSHWISLIELKSQVSLLSNGVGEDFVECVSKMLVLDELSKKIFMQKFEKGEAKILFDAFDEISPHYKENVLKLFKLFKTGGKSQIFITTRTHLKHDLETEFDVLSHKMKNLEEDEQIKFLTDQWKLSNPSVVVLENDKIGINLYSEEYLKYFTKCARVLVEKISSLILENSSIIGLPLIVQGLATHFKDSMKLNFDDLLKEIQNVSISKIYEKIFETNSKLLYEKFPEKIKEYFTKPDGILKIQQLIALIYLFDEDLADELFNSRDEVEWPLEEIARVGIIIYDENNKIIFNHETYAEYLIAKILFDILKNKKRPSKAQIKLLIDILTQDKFQITRMFLNDMLENLNKNSFKFFETPNVASRKFCEAIEKNHKDIFKFIENEKLSNLFTFILNLIKGHSVSLCIEVLASKFDDNENAIDIFSRLKDQQKFQGILDEILSDDELSENLIMSTNLISVVASHGNRLSLQFLFTKVVDDHNNNLRKILLTKMKGKSILSLSACNNPNIETVQLLWEIFEKKFTETEILNIIKEKDDDNDNVFQSIARLVKFKENLEFMWTKIRSLFHNNEDLKQFLLIKGFYQANALLLSTYESNENSFNYLFVEIYCIHCEINDFIFEIDRCNDHLFHNLALYGSKSLFEIAITQLRNKLSRCDFDNFFKMINDTQRNILHLAGSSGKSEESLKFLLDFIKNEFGVEYLRNMLLYPDVHEITPLHYVLRWNKSVMVVKLMLSAYLENFPNHSDILHILKQTKNSYKAVRVINEKRENFEIVNEEFKKILPIADHFHFELLYLIKNENTQVEELQIFFFNVKNKLNRREFFEFLQLEISDGDNFFQHAARFASSPSIIEFLWHEIKSSILDKENLKKFLLVRGEWESNALTLSIKEINQNTFSYILETIYFENFSEDSLKFIYETDCLGSNFFMNIIRHGTISMLDFACLQLKKWLSIEDLRKFLTFKNKNNENLLHYSTYHSTNIPKVENLFNFIKNECGSVEFLKMLSENDDDGEIPLHGAIKWKSTQTVIFIYSIYEDNFKFDEIDRLLKTKNVINYTIFSANNSEVMNIINSHYSSTTLEYLEFTNLIMVESNVWKSGIDKLLVHVKSKKNGKIDFLNFYVVFLIAVQYSKSQEKLEFVWNKFKNAINNKKKIKKYLLSKNTVNANALIASIYKQNQNSFYFIFEKVYLNLFKLSEFIYEIDAKGNNFFHNIIKLAPLSMLEYAYKQLKNGLEKQKLRDFLKLVNKNKQNILHLAAEEITNIESMTFMLNLIEEVLSAIEIKEILIKQDIDNYLPLHYAVEKNVSKNLAQIFSIYEKYLTKNETLKILQTKEEKYHRNVFELARDLATNSRMFDTICRLTEDYDFEKSHFTLSFSDEEKHLD